jgi:hypothetical protein
MSFSGSRSRKGGFLGLSGFDFLSGGADAP